MKYRAKFIGIGAVASILWMAPTASAAWHNVHGTVYAGGTWYRSANIWYTGGFGTNVSVLLSSLPSGCNGMDWYLNGVSSGQPGLTGTTWIKSTGTDNVLGWVSANTGFQNNFKQHTAARGTSNYNFAGQEWY